MLTTGRLTQIGRAFVAVLLLVLAGPASALADDVALIGGGVTAPPPPPRLGANLVRDSGFESARSRSPWWAEDGWSTDLSVARSGAASLRLSNAHLVPYSQQASQALTLKKGVYRLSGWIKTSRLGANQAGSGVRLTVKSADGGGSTAVVRGTTDWKYYEDRSVVIGSDQTVTVRVGTYGDPSGTAWFDDVKLEPELPQALDVFMLYPNFRGMLFDDQHATLRFEVTVRPPINDYRRYRVVATLTEGRRTINTVTVTAAPQLTVELSAVGLRYGVAYLTTVKLVDSAGSTVYTAPPHRVSRVPADARAAMTVSFDDKNRILIRGEPRFVLGVYDASPAAGTTDEFWEQRLWSATGERRLGGVPINFYLNYQLGGVSTAGLTALVANLERHGVTYIQTANCFSMSRRAFPVDTYDSYVTAFADAGGGGYYTADECDPSMIPGTITQYVRLARLHPDSATFGTLYGNSALPLWRDAVDVMMTDPYALYGAEPPGGYRHSLVADWTENARTAVSNARPIMTVLQFFQTTSRSRWPTWADLRNHAYMAIVEGAKGLWWWALGDRGLAGVCHGWCSTKVKYMNNLASVIKEISSLEGVLLSDDRPSLLTRNTNPSAIRTLVKHFEGRTYVFAYNYTGTSTTVTLATANRSGTVTVHGERRTLAASAGTFTDTFGPYQAHVYVVDSAVDSSTAPLTALSPSGTIRTTTPTYRWSPLASTTSSYSVIVVDSAGNARQLRYTASALGCADGTGTCTLASPIALPRGTTQWRVMAADANGEPHTSRRLTFEVAP
jgi:hypothetical protein